ncbi:MAG: hypothetical protein AB2693_12740, partial [Candidatus Thiodiazotropha sp.]
KFYCTFVIMPPRKKARKGQSKGQAPKQTQKAAAHVPVDQAEATESRPEPEIVRLSGDGGQSGNSSEVSATGSNILNTWTSTLGAQGIPSLATISQNTHTEFQMPDVHCADDDITMHVPQDICIKIWKNEYINLAALLKKNQKRRGEESGNLFVNEHGQIQTRPKVLKEITNIREWTDAFLIFMAIYLKKYQDKVFELIQYMSTIREAESRCQSLAWREYDAEFRTRQALKHEPWNKIYSDLWLKLMTNTNKLEANTFQFKPSFAGQSNQSRLTLGICFDFNKGKCYFKNCRFSHVCLACKGDHPENQCPRQSQNFQQNAFTAKKNPDTDQNQRSSFRGPFKRK